MKLNRPLFFISLLLCLFASSSYSAIENFEFNDPDKEQLFRELTKVLRCPKCQNQNISDSNAGLAQDLRKKTYQLVNEGQTEEQVIDYMVERFGNFVVYDPPMTIATIFLWIGPLFFILFAGYFVYQQVKKQPEELELDPAEKKRLEKILAKNRSSAKR